MTDKFYPIQIDRLLQLYLNEMQEKDAFLGLPNAVQIKEFDSSFKSSIFNKNVEFPLGVAAGPHSQLSQNIISSWLCGARYIELKTVQTLDEIEVGKPCIDMQDEGYNCEWSQELKTKETFSQYLDAWIVLHIINHKRGLKNLDGTLFNMSVGYNLEGILSDNVQWFFDKMKNCSIEKKQKIEQIRSLYPQIDEIEIPDTISDNITLSTMHGCPSDEIEKIAAYLIEKRNFHTYVKLNPTLLGPTELRNILNATGQFDTVVPDEAFEHDLKYKDAILIIKTLQEKAQKANVQFGLKLTNTLESVNHKNVFQEEVQMMYMSGRALHPISVQVARKLQNEFKGALQISFAGGADAFNFPEIIACGLSPVTVSTDLLKPGGYGRLAQYKETLQKEFDSFKVGSINDYILKKSGTDKNILEAALSNLNKYADWVVKSPKYQKVTIKDPSIKGKRKLNYFDCIAAPCVENCATHQDIPDYLHFTANKNYNEAMNAILKTNPLPAITGNICDHMCQLRCTRINYDDPILIREVKRFVEENHNLENNPNPIKDNGKKVAIIGAGPSGLSCAYYLCLGGFQVDVFESTSKAGGMVSNAVPSFRLSDEKIAKDVERVTQLGVNITYNKHIDNQLFDSIYQKYDFMYIAVGAPLSSKINLPGIESKGVIEPLQFLHEVRLNTSDFSGKNVAIIGGGNTAMDAARVAYRMVGEQGKVTILYRRTKKEMPADLGEIKAVLQEGVEIIEKVIPEEVIVKEGSVAGLKCARVELVKKSSDGRLSPIKIESSEFQMEFDTIIPAVGQDTLIDFMDTDLFKPHPNTHEIKLKGVYTGGDAMRGAATAIKAISDGRKVAEKIISQITDTKTQSTNAKKAYSYSDLMKRRSIREMAISVTESPLTDRKNFKPVSYTINEESAVKESQRCLQCDQICNICVTVCPNRANYGYEVEPFQYNMMKAVRKGDSYELLEDKPFKIDQRFQILNIGDFCNECGNCTTFCPTEGAPYKEKPKFYLNIKSFNDVAEGYYFSKLKDKAVLIYKETGGIRTMENTDGKWLYETDHVKVYFEDKTFKPLDVTFKVPCAQQAHFQMAAEMSVLFGAAQNLYS